jgi:hypothetical protein
VNEVNSRFEASLELPGLSEKLNTAREVSLFEPWNQGQSSFTRILQKSVSEGFLGLFSKQTTFKISLCNAVVQPGTFMNWKIECNNTASSKAFNFVKI